MIRCGLIALPVILVALAPTICESQANDADRPRIGLVLSGGGARGAAHIGVIKVLDEMRIPIDYIAGTSMGAIVGGLYASGMSAGDLEQIILGSDWSILLSDRPPRAQRSYRRKTDDFGFLVNFDVGVSKKGLILPKGIVQGQNFTLALRRWLLPVATVKNFDRLPIPFRAIATNIVSGQEVILESGDLPTAIRASMSAPGVFKPVRVGDQVLVDGGVSNNLPIRIAKNMGADVLIVVDVAYPLVEEAELNSPLTITSQMMTILVNARAEQQKQLLTPSDLLITPELGLFGSQAFEQTAQAMRIGEASARGSMHELERFAVSEAEYVAHRASLQRGRADNPVIHHVAIENESRLSTDVLRARLSVRRDVPLDLDALELDIADIYGFDTFETVDYSIRARGAENELLIEGKSKSWGPNFLRFGINLEDDFDGNSTYNLATRLTMTELNRKGGEFRIDAAIGEDPQLAVEFYQPLDFKSRWFVNPRVSVRRSNSGLFDAGSQIAQFRSEETELLIGVGRILSNWGELRLTLARSFAEANVGIGDPALSETMGNTTAFQLGFGYDTIDRIAIPRFGTNLQLGWLGLREGFGAEQTADVAQLAFLKPQTWGRNTLLHWWDLGSVTKSGGVPLGAFELGGLFNLSGYSSAELRGDHRAIGRLLYYRRLGERSTPLFDTPMYVGGSVEVGNVWQTRSAISSGNALLAGSLFVVLDTMIGPLYLAYGVAEGGRTTAYLFLGQTF